MGVVMKRSKNWKIRGLWNWVHQFTTLVSIHDWLDALGSDNRVNVCKVQQRRLGLNIYNMSKHVVSSRKPKAIQDPWRGDSDRMEPMRMAKYICINIYIYTWLNVCTLKKRHHTWHEISFEFALIPVSMFIYHISQILLNIWNTRNW